MSAVGKVLLDSLKNEKDWKFGSSLHKHIPSKTIIVVDEKDVGYYDGNRIPLTTNFIERWKIRRLVMGYRKKYGDAIILKDIPPPTNKLPD